MKYRDTESGKIYDEIELLAEYMEHAQEIEEDGGARCFYEWIRSAANKNGFLEAVK